MNRRPHHPPATVARPVPGVVVRAVTRRGMPAHPAQQVRRPGNLRVTGRDPSERDVSAARTAAASISGAPRHVPHAFCVESAQARLLVVATPAGFEQFFFDTGEPAAALTVPPPPAAPPDLDALVAALAGYGVDVLGPPPAPQPAAGTP